MQSQEELHKTEFESSFNSDIYAFDVIKTDSAYFFGVCSFTESSNNTVNFTSFDHCSSSQTFGKALWNDVVYPCTKLKWNQPCKSKLSFATSSDALRLWEVHKNQELRLKATLANKRVEVQAPLTGLDWSTIDESLIITCSIDTTCTTWDLSTSTIKTQLIAHDSEVFDVQFVKDSNNVFGSVGADGSVRLFDLRSLDHSTIVYETTTDVSSFETEAYGAPLLRLEFNRVNSNYLTTIQENSNSIELLDIRMPGLPILSLKAHYSNVNSMSWDPNNSNILASAGDDCNLFVWNLKSIIGGNSDDGSNYPVFDEKSKSDKENIEPVLMYESANPLNSVEWSEDSRYICSASDQQLKVLACQSN